MANPPKEWLKVSVSPSGTIVTVSLQDGNLSAKYAVKTYESTVKKGVASARRGARKALADLRAAVTDTEEVSA